MCLVWSLCISLESDKHVVIVIYPTGCSYGVSSCGSDVQCFGERKRCDGHIDCTDGSDEFCKLLDIFFL